MRYHSYPFHIDSKGRTASVSEDEHIRQLIEQVLFTAPGERVNNPTFGSGVHQLLFAPLSDELVATTRAIIQSALSEWLGDLIVVDAVDVSHHESRLNVVVKYRVRKNQAEKIDEFAREIL